LKSADEWKAGKTFHGTMHKDTPYSVRIKSKVKESGEEVGWHARFSEHKEASFDEFWDKLGRNKAINEKEYIPEIKSAVLLKEVSPTQSIWTLHYHLSPPISDRIFTVLQTMHLEGGENGTPREGWIISVPVDVSEDAEMKAKEDKGVKGRYTSVELLREGSDGLVEWVMATASTPGGSIPTFFAEKAMPGQIYKDVPHFVHWLKHLKGKESAAKTEPDAPATTEGDAEPALPLVDPVSAETTEVAGTVNGNGEPMTMTA